jgi:hypothetical protein
MFRTREAGSLEFLRIEPDCSERQLSRENFAQSIRLPCEHEFPDDALDSLTSADDLEHFLSGKYVRGVLRRGTESWALIGVPESETNQDPSRCLPFALLWLARLRESPGRKNVAGARILLPPNSAALVAHLLPALHPEVKVHLFERDVVMERLQRIEPAAVANVSSWIVPARATQSLRDRAVRELAPLLPASRAALSFHPNLPAKEVLVRFRGLACLRWHESEISLG